jgi:ABC-type sugar transport system permease subunit
MASSSTKFGVALVLPLIALELLVSLYPIAYSLWLSFNNVNILAKTSNFIGFGNFAAIPSDFFIASAAAVSVRFIAETTLLVVALSMGMALVLNEKIRGLSVLKVIVILPWALSEFAIAITGRFFLDSNYGFLNALLLHLGIYKHSFVFLSSVNSVEWISLFYTWNFAPIGAFFILSALQTVPDELYKAAKIDGASPVTRFRLVTFPFIKYAVLITLVLATIQSGGAVVIFFALTGGGPGVSSTPVTLYDFRVFFNYAEYGYGAAISWATLVFIASATTTYFYLLTRRKK